MKSRTWMWTTVVSLFAALAMPVWTTAQEQQQQSQLPRYTVTDLGTLGGTFGFAQGINNRGWVEALNPAGGLSTQHSFLWADGVKQTSAHLEVLMAVGTSEGISDPTRGARFQALLKPPL